MTYAVALAFFTPALAQKNSGSKQDSARKARMEELKQYRHDLFVKKLKLTETEEAGFFPIYDEYQLKLREAKRSFRKKWKEKKPEDLTEEEAKVFLEDAIAARENEVELFKTYSEKLKAVIPVKKIVVLPHVEKEVQRELIEKFKGMKPPRGAGHGPRPKHGPPPPPPGDEE